MRYNINISYRTSELTKGSMSRNYIPFTWDEIPKLKNNDPLEIELMVGDRVIYSDPNNDKSKYNGMTAIITKITPEFSLAQRRNLLANRYLNRYIFDDEEEKKNVKKDVKKGGNKSLYDIDFLLDEIEEEEIDYLNIEGNTKTIKKGLKNVERSYLLGYTTKSLILDIESSIQDEQIIKDKVSRFLKYVFLGRGLQMIPKYVDKNKYKYDSMEDRNRDNSFFYTSSRRDVKVTKNIIRDISKREKKRKFKRNKDLYLIKDLSIEGFKINTNKKNSENDYTQKDINKSFYKGRRLRKDDELLNKTRTFLIKIYGESVGRKSELFEQILKKEDAFSLDDTYGSDLNKNARDFIKNVLMLYISNYIEENLDVKIDQKEKSIYDYIKSNIGYGFLKQPIIRQLFIIKKILEESKFLDYENKNLQTKKPLKKEVEKSISEIFERVYFNKSIINIDVNVKFYLRKGSSFGSSISLGSSCEKRRDVMGRDVYTLFSNLGLAWNEGRTRLRLGGKTRKKKKRKKRKKKTKKRKVKKGIDVKRKKRTRKKY
tara:strand:- start:591 stop:2216 length:1626 start_codon:yes stop_codon:yes gene_type:complete